MKTVAVLSAAALLGAGFLTALARTGARRRRARGRDIGSLAAGALIGGAVSDAHSPINGYEAPVYIDALPRLGGYGYPYAADPVHEIRRPVSHSYGGWHRPCPRDDGHGGRADAQLGGPVDPVPPSPYADRASACTAPLVRVPSAASA